MLLLTAEAHHVLDSSPVVPTAVEDDDLTSRWEVRHVALKVDLALLAVGLGWKGHRPKNAGADTFRDRFDRTARSCSVAALKYEDDAQALVFHPILEPAEFNLKFSQ